MGLKTIPFDAAPYLDDADAQAELLDDALQSGDTSHIGEALAVITRARGLAGGTDKANDAPASAEGGGPRLATLLDVARDLGLRLQVRAVAAE